MSNLFYQTIEIGFVYNGTNGEAISSAFPYSFMVGANGALIYYDAGFLPVLEGSVIATNGVIVASSMEEFNHKYAPICTREHVEGTE